MSGKEGSPRTPREVIEEWRRQRESLSRKLLPVIIPGLIFGGSLVDAGITAVTMPETPRETEGIMSFFDSERNRRFSLDSLLAGLGLGGLVISPLISEGLLPPGRPTRREKEKIEEVFTALDNRGIGQEVAWWLIQNWKWEQLPSAITFSKLVPPLPRSAWLTFSNLSQESNEPQGLKLEIYGLIGTPPVVWTFEQLGSIELEDRLGGKWLVIAGEANKKQVGVEIQVD